MAKIAFILLCHKDPEAIIQQAKQFTAVGDYIAIHFDARAPKEAYDLIREKLYGNPNVVFAKKRIKCGWGAWSLVQATLYAVEAAVDAFPRATHFYMVSGDCMSIKSAKYAHKFLDADDVDCCVVSVVADVSFSSFSRLRFTASLDPIAGFALSAVGRVSWLDSLILMSFAVVVVDVIVFVVVKKRC